MILGKVSATVVEGAVEGDSEARCLVCGWTLRTGRGGDALREHLRLEHGKVLVAVEFLGDRKVRAGGVERVWNLVGTGDPWPAQRRTPIS